MKNFVTGISAYWQPRSIGKVFCRRDLHCRNGMLISGIAVVVFVSLTAIVGIVTRAVNQPGRSTRPCPQFMLNYVPGFGWYTLILAAAMSSADSNLNAASVIWSMT